MASISIDYFSNLAKFLKIPLGKISIKDSVCLELFKYLVLKLD